MRNRAAMIAVGALLAACGSSLARGSARAASVCGPRAARTLATSRVARVYLQGANVYGCAGPRSYRLGVRDRCLGSPRVSAVMVVGALAGYGLQLCGVDTGAAQVVVRRLTDGRQLRSVSATGPLGPESFQSVPSLVLKGDGAVAWIGAGSSIVGARRVVEVREADAHGERLLDSGDGVASGSLRLHGSTLSWRDRGRLRTAALR